MTKRDLLRSPLALWPWTTVAATPRPSVYSQLGVRPLINFRGTMTDLGASKMRPELHARMAEASRYYVPLEELHDRIGEKLARLCGTEAAMVTCGAAAAIAAGTYGCLTGDDRARVRQLPDLTGLKTKAVILKNQRNGYDHAVRSAGVAIVEVDHDLQAALTPQVALMYYLGGTSHDWEQPAPMPLDQCVALCRAARVPLLVDAANMLPPWQNIRKLAAAGVDLIAISGGKHMRGPQSSGILAGRADLIRAARLNMSPHSDSQGRGMKVNREEMVGLWAAAEHYAQLDFAALDRECERQAAYLLTGFRQLGLRAEKTPFDRTRRVHRVRVRWDAALGTPAEIERQLWDGEPRIAVSRLDDALEFTVFMNEPGDERIALERMRQIFRRR